MSAYLFYTPQFRPLSPSGEILPGAYIQFYAAGTTTPADVYADADLDTKLTNPVVADSSGEFAAIYLDPTTTYRAQLYDADDVLIWDIDPLAPPRDEPPGTVKMFYGTEQALEAAYPPALWQKLDGNNGAPDIRDRVPIGVSSTIAPGDKGGSSDAVTTSAAGGHDHGGSTGSHALTKAQMPVHSHDGYYNAGFERDPPPTITDGHHTGVVIPGTTQNNHGTTDTTLNSESAKLTQDAGEGEGHSHGITAAGNHTHTVVATPPYLGLWFVMRRAA